MIVKKTIRDDVAISMVYGAAMNNVLLSNANHMNDNNNNTPSSSLSAAAAVAYPWFLVVVMIVDCYKL